MRNKTRYICGSLLMVLCLLISSCNFPTKSIGDIPNPQDTVVYFFDGLCAGDIDRADTCLGGTSLKIKGEFSGPFAEKLMAYLQGSYRYEIVGEPEIRDLDAYQTVQFTYLDMNLLADKLRSQSTKIGKNYIVTQNADYTTVNNGVCSLTDQGAETVAAEALDIVMKNNPEQYYTTEEFRVELKFQQNVWNIVLDNALFDAIAGKYTETDAADKQSV